MMRRARRSRTRQIMVHPTPMKMALVRKEGQAPVEAQATGQQDAAGDVQGVVAQGIGGEALGGDEVVGGDGGGGANPSEDNNCQVRDGHG